MPMRGGVSNPSISTPTSPLESSVNGPRMRVRPFDRAQPPAASNSARATAASSLLSKKPKNATPFSCGHCLSKSVSICAEIRPAGCPSCSARKHFSSPCLRNGLFFGFSERRWSSSSGGTQFGSDFIPRVQGTRRNVSSSLFDSTARISSGMSGGGT